MLTQSEFSEYLDVPLNEKFIWTLIFDYYPEWRHNMLAVHCLSRGFHEQMYPHGSDSVVLERPLSDGAIISVTFKVARNVLQISYLALTHNLTIWKLIVAPNRLLQFLEGSSLRCERVVQYKHERRRILPIKRHRVQLRLAQIERLRLQPVQKCLEQVFKGEKVGRN